MPKVTITLEDTAGGGLSISSDYTPQVGAPCSAAQGAALAIIARTRREWGFVPATPQAPSEHGPTALCRALLDPEDLGHAVPQEVRERAKRALWGTSQRPTQGAGAW